ncbi:threonine aldolase family protein [Sphingobacterium spiritivorum]|uniref:Beta-eliminating lyase n=1 Tax=Sphingobacterium spiritivorum ATCC 33861 TaxID=525373 RepID=D7VKK0_SPHSI|nr:beta-eliminating lyase-related protein [Sphingobacterium spiritivorum]EFK58802.1 Beta-eliminating lyase [Sphingobacterium spiritivorum ATCC 33861]QQT34317.1 threonine aldolase [Sphingobacterium spiritivorum]WQD35159.1 beta-eliminating lyase-related protein [Sphingobacterium spiritivorum]SUI99499.1 Low specificity L-threonine aldolase [Sphingobacterium spiritivorum]
MYSFKNDYSEGAHPHIIDQLVRTNLIQQNGYSGDDYCIEAKEILRRELDNPGAAIYFVSGGTQANLISIASLLRTHEAVISATTGHIFANETGAIESTGHKVIAVDKSDGKLEPADIERVLSAHSLAPHMVKPRLVYISNSTEIGTHYTKTELQQLSVCCRKNSLLLYMDGARLGHALTAAENDLTLADISRLADIFYIGATKNGGLLGEAIVLPDPTLHPDFDFVIKQKGGLLSKGRLLGIQFRELFRDGLYFRLAQHANAMAMKIAHAVKECKYDMLTVSFTNQIFPILPLHVIEELSTKYDFYVWKQIDESQSAVRLITSWATEEYYVDEFIKDLKRISS